MRGIPRPLADAARRIRSENPIFLEPFWGPCLDKRCHLSFSSSFFPPPLNFSLYLRISVSIVHRFLRKPLCVKCLQRSPNKNHEITSAILISSILRSSKTDCFRQNRNNAEKIVSWKISCYGFCSLALSCKAKTNEILPQRHIFISFNESPSVVYSCRAAFSTETWSAQSSLMQLFRSALFRTFFTYYEFWKNRIL